VALGMLRRDLLALLFFLGAATGILAFESIKYVGYLRHHGHFSLSLFVSPWRSAPGRGVRTTPPRFSPHPVSFRVIRGGAGRCGPCCSSSTRNSLNEKASGYGRGSPGA